jgi:hypothetical protein
VDRVKEALGGFPGVTKVEFIAVQDEFRINYQAEKPLTEEFKSIISQTVVAPTAREALGKVGKILQGIKQ